MISQGTDGLSRADCTQGSMVGNKIAKYIPLHLSTFVRSPGFKKWLKWSMKDLDPRFLNPSDWFEHAHDFGNYVWSPPPAAADVVVEQLGKARLKRPEALHVIVVPRLITGL